MSRHTDEPIERVDSTTTESILDGNISRRAFLGGVTAALGAASLPTALAQADAEQSLNAIIADMSLDDKISLLHQHSGGIIPALPDHGVPEIDMRDGPNGVRTSGPQSNATAFPTNIVTASTFDPALVRKEAAAIGREIKADDANVLLGPANNINRVPVGGRTFEYYSEDPNLSAALTAEFTKGVQSEDVLATVKHYVANSQEHQRGEINADVSERVLREIYYPSFKAAVQDGGAAAVMAALNKVNGEYCTENRNLLQRTLKDEWGFEGYVISDFYGVHSVVDAAKAGHDVELVHGAHFGDPLKEAVQNGDVSEQLIDEKVHRVLWALQSTGAFDGVGDGAIGTDEHFSIARQIAEEGSVLLKNENDVLPFDEAEIDSLAIVGHDPDSFRIAGGGSSLVPAIREVGLVEGIETIVGDDVTITAVSSDPFQLMEADVVSPPDASGAGFKAEYFDNSDLSGEPVSSETDEVIHVDSTGEVTGISGPHSIRWSAELTAPAGGTYRLAIESLATTSLSIDGETILENEGGMFEPTVSIGQIELEADTVYDVTVELTGAGAGPGGAVGSVSLDWDRPDVDPLGEAINTVTEADAAIAVVTGSSTEGQDRDDMVLDGNQDELVEQVGTNNDNSIVLVNTGGPVEMPWIDYIPGALQVWYPGQEAGSAVGNLLFGHVNPSGKLPMTFGESIYDYPANDPDSDRTYPGVDGTVHYDEGVFVGYRHFDAEDIEPLFEFGHGLSYTDFEYGEVTVEPTDSTLAEGVTVSVEVSNVGDRDGAEVVQVYVSDVDPAVERPPKELKGFAKVEVAAGETETAEIDLDAGAFQYWDPEMEAWTTSGGEFEIMVGASSRDIKATETVTIASRQYDVNGDGETTVTDVQALFDDLESDRIQNNPEQFDFNGDGDVTVSDVVALFRDIV